jgi:hypothetical protein
MKTAAPARRLRDLEGVGPATLDDLHRLGVRSVDDLARRDPEALYRRLGALEGKRPDPCCLDVFRSAVAQANDPDLPAPMRTWWWWSRRRKAAAR